MTGTSKMQHQGHAVSQGSLGHQIMSCRLVVEQLSKVRSKDETTPKQNRNWRQSRRSTVQVVLDLRLQLRPTFPWLSEKFVP